MNKAKLIELLSGHLERYRGAWERSRLPEDRGALNAFDDALALARQLDDPPVPASTRIGSDRAPVKIAEGDEWTRYRYRGHLLFDTDCGVAGVYRDGRWLARTLEQAVPLIDAEEDAKEEVQPA